LDGTIIARCHKCGSLFEAFSTSNVSCPKCIAERIEQIVGEPDDIRIDEGFDGEAGKEQVVERAGEGHS
jgi:protein-arginine kinase activator protein McsA